MAGRFKWTDFSQVNLQDPFFESLKQDYTEFPTWFERKSKEREKALVFSDKIGIGAFLYLKNENEPIALKDMVLPAKPRVKIGTLRLAERFRGKRYGEGAIGIALWKWQQTQAPEIYVTVFQKHQTLIRLFERFGFKCAGLNKRGECVYVKSRLNLDYSNAYKAFPFIRPDFETAGIIPIEQEYHDQLFPYSELKVNTLEIEEETAGNGITKIFIGFPFSTIHYSKNQPVFIYRKYRGPAPKTYRSVITSFCTITKVCIVKTNGLFQMPFDEFLTISGNKTIFSQQELADMYRHKKNIVLLQMVYNGFFGKGHNVIYKDLKSSGFFPDHPYNITYNHDDFIKILRMGDVDVQNVIID